MSTFAAMIDETRGVEQSNTGNAFAFVDDDGQIEEISTTEDDNGYHSVDTQSAGLQADAPSYRMSGDSWIKATTPEIEQVEFIAGQPQLTINGQTLSPEDAIEKFRGFDMRPVINDALENLKPEERELAMSDPQLTQQFIM